MLLMVYYSTFLNSLLSKATLDRLSKMNITCSNRCSLNKMDDLGANYDREQKAEQTVITDENLKLAYVLQKLDKFHCKP